MTGLALLALSWTLIALTFIDLDHQLLPDRLTLPLLWLGLLLNSGGLFTSLPHAVYGAAAGYLLLWSVYWLFKLVTGKEGMGYGDFKLLAAIGAWGGYEVLPLTILLSSVVGVVLGAGAHGPAPPPGGQSPSLRPLPGHRRLDRPALGGWNQSVVSGDAALVPTPPRQALPPGPGYGL